MEYGSREMEPSHQSNIESQPVEFSDPVDNLAERFIKSVEINENINRYDDFVETDDEFDDILYMKRLEDQTAYKKYYGDKESKSGSGLCEIGEDFRCKDDYKDKEYEHHMELEVDKCPCKKDNKGHEEHHENHPDSEEHRSEQCDYKDKEHEHHMKLEDDKCSCEKDNKDYENYLDSEEYGIEQRDHKDKKL